MQFAAGKAREWSGSTRRWSQWRESRSPRDAQHRFLRGRAESSKLCPSKAERTDSEATCSWRKVPSRAPNPYRVPRVISRSAVLYAIPSGAPRTHENLKKKVEAALAEACKPDGDPEIQLDDAGNRLAGLIISGSFAGKSPHQRQDHIWHYLDEALSGYERTLISFIVIETPEEHRVLQEER